MKKSFLFILLLTLFFIPKDTFAIEKTSLYPNELYLYHLSSDRNSQLEIARRAANNRYFYGYTFTTAQERNMMRFYYNFADNPIQRQIVDIDFIILHETKSAYLNPIQVYVQSGEQLTSCSVSTPQQLMLEKWYSMGGTSNDTFDQYESPIGYYSSVSCDEAYIYDNLAVVVGQNFLSQVDGFVGVSALGIKTASSQDLSNQIQINSDAVKEQTQATKEQTDFLKDNDTSDSKDQASGFFNDFEDNDFGLSDVITTPLVFIQGLANNSCNNLNLPLPFVEQNATLPCMTSIYQQHFGAFLTIYQIITTGFISYWVCINIFRMVKNFKNPNNDEVEVLDL